MRFLLVFEQERFTMMNRNSAKLTHRYDKYIYRQLNPTNTFTLWQCRCHVPFLLWQRCCLRVRDIVATLNCKTRQGCSNVVARHSATARRRSDHIYFYARFINIILPFLHLIFYVFFCVVNLLINHTQDEYVTLFFKCC